MSSMSSRSAETITNRQRGADAPSDHRIDKGTPIMTTDLSPIHPGEILREDFLEPFGITQNRLERVCLMFDA